MTNKPLTKTHPEIAKDWDLEKNGSLRPEQVFMTSKDKVWWRCAEGHEYRVSVYSRVRSGGCKVCQKSDNVEKTRLTKLKKSTSLSIAQPQLIAEWDYDRNMPLLPDTVSHKSSKLLWWKCQYAHTWQSTPARRSRGDGCPICNNINTGIRFRKRGLEKAGQSFAAAYPELLKEWDYKKNALQPTEIAPKSNYMANWRCKYGHGWNTTVTNRTNNGSNCPKCNPQSSRIEIYLLCELRSIFNDVKWRWKFKGVECDIYIPEIQIGIEVDGEYWHRNKAEKDYNKTQFLTGKGINLIRVRERRLPFVDGTVVEFHKDEILQEVALRLLKEISVHFTSERLTSYLDEGVQKNLSAYKKILSRLPAPPSGDTLGELYPEVASEWDYEANLPLTPALFPASSSQKVAWVCIKGHHWDAVIKNRTGKKSGCPICYKSNHSENMRQIKTKNTISLTQGNPAYLSKFDTAKNVFPPSEIALKSGKNVWWRCENGHSFQKSPCEMAKHNDCTVCNSLPFAYPEVVAQWDKEKNADKQPEDYSWGSGEKVWWRCSKGHSWKTAVSQRTSAGYGCRQCSNERIGHLLQEQAVKKKGSLAESNPSYLAEWDYIKNADISPDSLTAKSKCKVWWVCPKKHSYIQSLESKARGTICPECANIKSAESTRCARLIRTGSLADNHPEIALQWHTDKNGKTSAQDLSSGSHQVVWWRCDNGHEWQESPNARTDKRRQRGCPTCREIRK
jgi:very-short-patch-repair endonuclease